jgi:hypothetical protein
MRLVALVPEPGQHLLGRAAEIAGPAGQPAARGQAGEQLGRRHQQRLFKLGGEVDGRDAAKVRLVLGGSARGGRQLDVAEVGERDAEGLGAAQQPLRVGERQIDGGGCGEARARLGAGGQDGGAVVGWPLGCNRESGSRGLAHWF